MSDNGIEKTLATAFSLIFALYVVSIFSESVFLTTIEELGLFLYLFIPVLTPIAVGYVLLSGRSTKHYTQAVLLTSLLLSGGMLAYLLTDGPIPLQTYHKVGGTLLFTLSLMYLYFNKLLLSGDLTLVRHETIVTREEEEEEEAPPEKKPEEEMPPEKTPPKEVGEEEPTEETEGQEE